MTYENECRKASDYVDATNYMYRALHENNEDRLVRLNQALLDDNDWLRKKKNRRLVLASNTVHSPKKVIYNNVTTIVYWDDDTKTIVTCQEGDAFSYETGYAMAFLKKHMGNKGHFNTDLAKIMDKAVDQDLRKEK